MHGVVADYDAEALTGDWEGLVNRWSADFPPAYGSATFSKGVRLVWLFEEPILVYEEHAHAAFLTRLARELKLPKLFAAFDREAFDNPTITYECGNDWRPLNPEAKIRTSTINAWLFEAGKKGRWSGGVDAVDVPLDRVREEIEKQFPGRWQGDFSDGARGPRFWDQTADNPTAAVVRGQGMQCFTGDQPFVSWREILGPRFVAEFAEKRIDAAINDVYYDGRHYWRKDLKGQWVPGMRENLVLHFKVACGMRSEKSHHETSSEVDQALYHVEQMNRVSFALPLVHQPIGVVVRDGATVLNTSNVGVVQPAEVDHRLDWGERFPFIAKLLDGFFASPEQSEFFLSWLKRFYVGAYGRDIEKGQAAWIAGKVQTGKTLIAGKLVGTLMGGSVDASSYLLGETTFNSSLYSSAVWTVDDSNPGTDARVHAKFSANVKKLAANQSFEFLAKFRDSAMIRWMGRTIITLNDDSESLRILPDADSSILDKVMLFRAADRKFQFPPKADEVIRTELPAFARWLIDYEYPAHCLGDNRFGVCAYHDPLLLGESRRMGRSGEFRELLAAFRKAYFSVHPDDTSWEGTSTELLQVMSLDDGLADVLRQQRMSATSVGRELSKLQSRGYSISAKLSNGHKLWAVGKEDGFTTEVA
jgi:hypothetical protein